MTPMNVNITVTAGGAMVNPITMPTIPVA